MNHSHRKAVSLVEVLIAIAMLSTLALPMGMFLIEYSRGSLQLGDYYQILNLVEQKLEIAMEMPFNSIPDGESSETFITNPSGVGLDLHVAEIAKKKVHFKLVVETLPVGFAALRDAFSGQLQRVRVEQGMKRLELTAKWGDKQQHNITLLAYKANL